MGENTSRYRAGPARVDVYWRRRVIALVIGLAIVGIVSWAVNGTLSVPGTAHTTSLANEAPGGGTGTGAGGGAGGRGGGGAGAAGAAGGSRARHAPARGSRPGSARHARSGVHRPRAAGHAGHRVPGAGRHPGAGSGRSAGHNLAACRPGQLVLSLHQQHASYRGRAWPQFEADVVSTSAQPCTVRTGARAVSVIVRTGQQPLWDSSACAAGSGPGVSVLTKGVPAVLHVRWDRKIYRPGCRGRGRPARPGAFVATAVSGRLVSNSLIFVLRAPGVAVP